MSATLEAKPVARYLDCAVLESQGRSFPVEMRYQSWDDDGPVWERAAAQVDKLMRETDTGDMLVFMPGMSEIIRTIDLIREQRHTGARHARLHGEMSSHEQDRVFAPSDYAARDRRHQRGRNLDHDPGHPLRHRQRPGPRRALRPERAASTRCMLNRSHAHRLISVPAAPAASRPGMCYRLWSEQNHGARALKNTPEVQRTELSSALLMIHGHRRDATSPRSTFWTNPNPAASPSPKPCLKASAQSKPAQSPPLGEQMYALPVHPRYARMLLEARHHGCVREAALLAALVSGRDLLVRINPRDERDRLIKRNRQSLIKRSHKSSDYFLLANSYAFSLACNFDGKQSFQHGVNAHVAREVRQTHEQLLTICEEAGLPTTPFAGDDAALTEAIARCHLFGFIDHLAVRTSSGSSEFDLIDGRRCEIMDESIAGGNMLIVVSEIREISARNGDKFTLLGVASAVKPEWVRALNPPGLHETVDHVYDRLNKRVVAGRVLRYHDLLLGGERVETLDPVIAARVLAEEFADQLTRLPQAEKLRARLAGKSRDEIVDVLTAAWLGATSWAEAQKIDVLGSMR